MSSLLCLLSTNTLLLSLCVVCSPYSAVYMVSGDAALCSVGRLAYVRPQSRAVHIVLATTVSQRRSSGSDVVGLSRSKAHVGACGRENGVYTNFSIIMA